MKTKINIYEIIGDLEALYKNKEKVREELNQLIDISESDFNNYYDKAVQENAKFYRDKLELNRVKNKINN